MKGREIILGAVQGREAAALIVDGRLEDLLIDGDTPRPGSIYRARIGRPAKGTGGLFLDTPDGSAFLRQTKGLRPGDTLLVQVTGHAERGKALPVTAKLLFKSRYAIVTPGAPGLNVSRAIRDEETRLAVRAAGETEVAEASGFGVILRSACAGADADAIAEDVDATVALAAQVLNDEGQEPELLVQGDGPHAIAWRDWDGHVRESDLEDWLDEVGSQTIRIEGGSLSVEPTRALVAVDVNAGGDFSHSAGLKANLAAAHTLPRILRVKGLGGQIVVDFAPMAKGQRRQVEDALRRALKDDGIETALVGWTSLGLFELQRKRERAPLAALVSR
jgi:Ribonuclease G/E